MGGWGRFARSGLRAQLNSLRDDTRSRFKEVRDDIREIRQDMKLLTGKLYEMKNQREKRRASSSASRSAFQSCSTP